MGNRRWPRSDHWCSTDMTTAKTPLQARDAAVSIEKLQAALRQARLDGWLFYDFRQSDPLAYRILGLDESRFGTRRWFYFLPAEGEPVRIVHSIERGHLDALPGRKLVYLPWQQLHQHLRETLSGARRIAMQYSPNNDIPYVSRVDAGTIELIRSFGAEVVSSAELVARFEAVWTPEQWRTHQRVAPVMRRIVDDTFCEIRRLIEARGSTHEYQIQQFMMTLFDREGLTTDHPPIVAVNANSADPHYAPTEAMQQPIRRDDFVLIDLWSKLRDRPDAVYVDITWTGYVGDRVPARYEEIFQIVRAARDGAADFVQRAVREGRVIHGWEVDDVCRGMIRDAGYADRFIHRTGHSIDREVHGSGSHIDNLETRDFRAILPNTCFSIEPGIYLEGEFGVRSEIDVYISATEAIITGQPIQTTVIPILAV